MKKTIVNIIITLCIGLILYYLTLPAINLTSPGFYSFIIVLLLVYGVLSLGSSVKEVFTKRRFSFRFNTIILIPFIILMIIIINFFSSPLFHSKAIEIVLQ